MKELKKIFRSDLSEISKTKIEELGEERSHYFQAQENLRKIIGLPDWLYKTLNSDIQAKINAIDKKRVYWNELTVKRRKERFININHIKKECKVEDYLGGKPLVRGDLKYYNCIFHNEKTPSMMVKNNLFYCFGCQKGGSVIDIVMKTNKMDFKEAINFLNKNL